MKISAILVGAGVWQRMWNIDKTQIQLQGKTLLFHCLDTFQASQNIDEIVVVVKDDKVEETKTLIDTQLYSKVTKVIAWWATRQDSTLCGLEALENTDIVLVHDIARPLVDQSIISEVIQGAKEFWGAVPGIKVSDTIKKWADFIDATIDRDTLYRIQTPQAFSYDLLKKAFDKAQKDTFLWTDEASVVENFWEKIKIVPGKNKNLKITYKEDIALAKSFLVDPSKRISIKSYVKINLSLQVWKKLENWYHEISSLFQAVNLYDLIDVTRTDTWCSLIWSIICENEANLLSKAHRLMEAYTKKKLMCQVHLIKACPISAGLWGGSSNAGAFMVALNELFDLGLTKKELCELGLQVWADVPFFITNYPTALVEWIGDKITPSTQKPMPFYVLARPHKRINTGVIFQKFDETGKSFYEITSEICPAVKDMCEYFATLTPVYGMSGTGPTCFAWFKTSLEAQKAIENYGVEKFNGDWFIVEPTTSTYEVL